MDFDVVRTPSGFLRFMLGDGVYDGRDYEAWWESDGKSISERVDAAGTPWLRMHDRLGHRVDEILLPPEYWTMLKRGYTEGIVWRPFEEQSFQTSYQLGYLTSFYDAGLYCPYTVSLSTAVQIAKYADAAIRERFLPPMLQRTDRPWQGATWMTEVRGGSDLGAAVETLARADGAAWRLTGEKYFASNAGAELAVVAARPEGAPKTVRGLALFLLPRLRNDGTLNYYVRRLKDKIATRSVPTGEVELTGADAFLLGKTEWGVYLILEVLNISRVANSIASVAVAQRALADAYAYAAERSAFGKPIIQHPLLRRQFDERAATLQQTFALAWECVRLLDAVWREQPPYSERYHLFRLITHLAKYWTAEFAVQTAKWAMEVHGGIGTLAEHRVERWLREAMILAIWEGTPHRQILDGVEVMHQKGAHRLLFDEIAPWVEPHERDKMLDQIERHLALPTEQREAEAESVFRSLASFAARAFARKLGRDH
jgi:acyl-CoA dehydrogenase